MQILSDDVNQAARAEILDEVTNDVVNTISQFSGNEGMAQQFDSLRLGVSQTGTKSSIALNPLFVEGTANNTKSLPRRRWAVPILAGL